MSMRKTECALCCTQSDYTILYAENLPTTGISSVEYDSRRMRDYMHFQIVKCKTCNLVRSDPIIDPELIDNLYEESDCSYTTEKENEPLARTYGRYLENIINSYDVNRNSYLDIGCSNGFMIERAIEMGFSKFFTKRTISIIIISALFYTIFSLIPDIQQISNKFASVDIFYIPLILCFHFLAMGIRSIRQKVFFDSLNIKLSNNQISPQNFIGSIS